MAELAITFLRDFPWPIQRQTKEGPDGLPDDQVQAAENILTITLNRPDKLNAFNGDSRAVYSRGASADAREGVMSFLEKRPAKFTNLASHDMPSFFPWWDEEKFS